MGGAKKNRALKKLAAKLLKILCTPLMDEFVCCRTRARQGWRLLVRTNLGPSRLCYDSSSRSILTQLWPSIICSWPKNPEFSSTSAIDYSGKLSCVLLSFSWGKCLIFKSIVNFLTLPAFSTLVSNLFWRIFFTMQILTNKILKVEAEPAIKIDIQHFDKWLPLINSRHGGAGNRTRTSRILIGRNQSKSEIINRYEFVGEKIC